MIRAATVLLNRFVFLAVVAFILQAYLNTSSGHAGGDVLGRMSGALDSLKKISDALR